MKDSGCCLTNFRNGGDEQSFYTKIIHPSIVAWVKKPHKCTVIRDGAYVASLSKNKKKTGVCQVVWFCQASVLLADDMIHFAPEKCILLMDQAILT